MCQTIFYITLFIGIFPLLLLLFKGRGFDSKYPVIPFIWFTALATAYEFVRTELLEINANYWFQLYSLLEFVTLYYFFYRLSGHIYNTIYRIFPILFIIPYVISVVFWSEADKFISLTINKINITLFVLASVFLWFKSLFKKMDIMNLWSHSNFYFVSGFFIYYSATFCLFLLSNLLFNSELYAYDYWSVNIMATLVLRALLIIGVWKTKPLLK